MKKVSSSILAAAMGLAAWATMSVGAWAQESRTLGSGAIVVRLCPASCVAVNGHGLKSGGKVTVYETKSGWVRVSDYLNRNRLVQSFGNSITRRPALWVASSQLAGGAATQDAATPKPAPAATAEASPAPAVPRRLTIPTFRPGTSFAKVEAADPKPSEDKPAETETVETKPVEPADPKPVAEAKPLDETESAADGTRRALTWEELQQRLAKQAEEQKRRAEMSEAEKAALAKEEAEQAAREAEIRRAAAAAEAAKAAKAEAARKAAEAAEAAKAEEARKAAEAEEAAEAAKAAEAAAAKQAELEAEAKKQAEEAAKQAAAKEAEEAAKEAEEAAKAAEAEAAKAAEAEAAKAAEAEAAKAAEAAAAAAAAATEEASAAEAEEDYNPDVSNPIKLGARPSKMTKALRDKRLSKLPGTKGKLKLEAVIALRHYALGLLNSGECKGISGGGPSAVPGMLFVACSDDPTYLRQFPLKEETW